jgi:hypothetical protein
MPNNIDKILNRPIVANNAEKSEGYSDRYECIVTGKTSIARQRLVKDHCRATLGKQCLKAGILKSIA